MVVVVCVVHASVFLAALVLVLVDFALAALTAAPLPCAADAPGPSSPAACPPMDALALVHPLAMAKAVRAARAVSRSSGAGD